MDSNLCKHQPQLASVAWTGINNLDHCAPDNKSQAFAKETAKTDEHGSSVYAKVGTRRHTPVCVHAWDLINVDAGDTDKQTELERDGCRQKEGHWLSCIPVICWGFMVSKKKKEKPKNLLAIQFLLRSLKKNSISFLDNSKKAFLECRELYYKTHYYVKNVENEDPWFYRVNAH